MKNRYFVFVLFIRSKDHNNKQRKIITVFVER